MECCWFKSFIKLGSHPCVTEKGLALVASNAFFKGFFPRLGQVQNEMKLKAIGKLTRHRAVISFFKQMCCEF